LCSWNLIMLVCMQVTNNLYIQLIPDYLYLFVCVYICESFGSCHIFNFICSNLPSPGNTQVIRNWQIIIAVTTTSNKWYSEKVVSLAIQRTVFYQCGIKKYYLIDVVVMAVLKCQFRINWVLHKEGQLWPWSWFRLI